MTRQDFSVGRKDVATLQTQKLVTIRALANRGIVKDEIDLHLAAFRVALGPDDNG